MNLRSFDKLKPKDFENGAVIDEIRRAYVALNEHIKYNGLRNDLDAYLYYMALWATENDQRPNPKHFGLE